jgi:hypothetical protein
VEWGMTGKWPGKTPVAQSQFKVRNDKKVFESFNGKLGKCTVLMIKENLNGAKLFYEYCSGTYKVKHFMEPQYKVVKYPLLE